ncbi:MAG: hypothetical protein WCT51_04335 [Candidatus Shapirobacteria bacterium]|jgi:hypothetical protein
MDNNKLNNPIIGDIKKALVYINSDLNRLIKEIKPRNNIPGDCNFPIILFCLTSIEFLGTLCFDDSTDEQRSKKYIEKYFIDNKSKELIYKFGILNFVNIFRNGLTHNFYVKHGFGIQRKSREILFLNRENKFILRTNKFVNSFLKSLSSFEEELKNNNFQDEICRRYLKLINDDNKKFNVFSSKVSIDNFTVKAANASTSSYNLCPSAANVDNIYD